MKPGERYCPICRYWDGHEQDCWERQREQGPGSPFEPPKGGAMTEVTLSHRTCTDEYGSGTEIRVTAYTYRLTADDLEELGPYTGKRWAIRLDGVVITYGPGGAVLHRNPEDLDPYGEWRHDLRDTEPPEADCHHRAAAELASYVAGLEAS